MNLKICKINLQIYAVVDIISVNFLEIIIIFPNISNLEHFIPDDGILIVSGIK
jgi:hypothetical protein